MVSLLYDIGFLVHSWIYSYPLCQNFWPKAIFILAKQAVKNAKNMPDVKKTKKLNVVQIG